MQVKIIFKIKENTNKQNVYWLDDGSFGELNSFPYFQISLSSTFVFLLNVDKNSLRIPSVEGYFPLEAIRSVKQFKFNPPVIFDGELQLVFSEGTLNDDGCFMPLANQNIYYDQERQILGIGELENSNCICVRFGETLFAFFEDDILCGVALKLIKNIQ